ncbi:MAG: helix-turn-helix domain-containing protein, partial [Gammaproteobacteria bacterium]
GAMLVSPHRMLKVAVALRPATLLRFHRALVRRKYQWLLSAKTPRRPGPRGPSKELIAAVLEIKRLNPRFGCPRIAQQISHAFGLEIDKDVVRRCPTSEGHILERFGRISRQMAISGRFG